MVVKADRQYVKYLVCYDIEDNKKRQKFAQALSDLGLVRLQYSVFYGDLKSAEARAMVRTAREMLKADTDRCFWLPCRIEPERLQDCIGYEDFTYVEPDGHEVI